MRGEIIMTQQYHICHNCGASLTPDQAYCPQCGAQYIEPMIQQPVVPPPPQAQTPYQPQDQSYAPPPTPSPYSPSSYGQQALMTPEQTGGSPPPPQTTRGVSPFLIIAIVVVVLLLLVGIGSLFYNLGQQNGSKPGTTPIPGITPTPTPTSGTTPIPTPSPKITPGTTPTATSFRAPARSTTVSSLSIGKAFVFGHNSSASELRSTRTTLQLFC